VHGTSARCDRDANRISGIGLRLRQNVGKASSVEPKREELGRVARTGWRLPTAMVAVALLLAVSVVKPWSGPRSVGPVRTASQRDVVAGVSAGAPTIAPSASAVAEDPAGTLCQSPDGWRVVADDVELGRSVRTWLVATVEYADRPPPASTIPVTSLISGPVTRLGFCAPAGNAALGTAPWTGWLWRQNGPTFDPASSQLVARLTPMPGSLGALADPVQGSVFAWPPGRYVLEASFQGLPTQAWLGLSIESAR
jgi:hypothetical protein